jgi:hypothetical protein
MKKKIVILTLEDSPNIMQCKYLLKHLVLLWKNQGFDVDVVQGIKKKIKADIIFSHIDLTIVPDEYNQFLKDYPIVINGKAKDISKSLVSQNLLKSTDDYKGIVIVKTIENYGGMPELGRLKCDYSEKLALFKRQEWKDIQYLDSHYYPRFDSIKDVPQDIWKNEKLIVEKFLPELDEMGHYCVRKYFFLGNKQVGIYQTSDNPIVKTAKFKNELIMDDIPIPIELMDIRRRLGLDFGRLDYTLVNGKAVVYDTNKTAAIGDNGLSLIGKKLAELATGIQYYL